MARSSATSTWPLLRPDHLLRRGDRRARRAPERAITSSCSTRGGPANATNVLLYETYLKAFEFLGHRPGLGAAPFSMVGAALALAVSSCRASSEESTMSVTGRPRSSPAVPGADRVPVSGVAHAVAGVRPGPLLELPADARELLAWPGSRRRSSSTTATPILYTFGLLAVQLVTVTLAGYALARPPVPGAPGCLLRRAPPALPAASRPDPAELPHPPRDRPRRHADRLAMPYVASALRDLPRPPGLSQHPAGVRRGRHAGRGRPGAASSGTSWCRWSDRTSPRSRW